MNQPILPRPVVLIILASALATLALTSGCILAAAGAGAGTVAYMRGDVEATLGATLANTLRATNQAVQQLGYAKISEMKDALLATVIARNSADKKIEIRLESAGDKLTKVKIRVAVFGDEAVSQAVLEKIKANL